MGASWLTHGPALVERPMDNPSVTYVSSMLACTKERSMGDAWVTHEPAMKPKEHPWVISKRSID